MSIFWNLPGQCLFVPGDGRFVPEEIGPGVSVAGGGGGGGVSTVSVNIVFREINRRNYVLTNIWRIIVGGQ